LIVISPLPPLSKLRFLFIALIATISLQAMPAEPIPLMRDHGSAFSAQSSEVAVLFRRDIPSAKVATPQPLPFARSHAPVEPLDLQVAVAVIPNANPSRAPPVPKPVRLKHASTRAPPLSV